MRGRAARRARFLAAAAIAAGLATGSLVSASVRPAAAQDRRLVHAPPDSLLAGTQWECVVLVARPDEWEGIDLLFRRGGSGAFTLLPMTEVRGAFRATVPGDKIAPPSVEYSVSGRLAVGGTATLPADSPEERPFRVRVSAAAEGIVVLAPSEDEVTATDLPEIAALFDPPLADPSDATLLLDGIDRTPECERSPDYILLAPKSPLAAGAHEATVIVFPDSGGPRARAWRFFALSAASAAGQAPGAADAGAASAAWPAAGGSVRTVSGRWEAGWAVVDAEDSADPLVLPYQEISRAAFDASLNASSRDGATSFRAEATRNPIYDDEVRGSARFDRGRLRLEAGDIYPYLSDLSIAWQSGKGGLAQLDSRRVRVTVLGLRTLEAEVSDGFGSYSEYLWGAAAAARLGASRAAVHVAYGYDRMGSIPDSARFTDPRTNRVASLLVGRRLGRRLDLAVEVAASRTTEEALDGGGDAAGAADAGDSESAAALRAVATLGESGANQLSLEYHDYGRGFNSAGSPTVDSGERGVVIDANGRLPAKFRGNVRAEIYTDRDIYTALAEGSPIVQVTTRLDREMRRPGGTLSAYLLGRAYHVPYADAPYDNRYATLGAYAQHGRATLSTSVTRSRTESAAALSDADAVCSGDSASVAEGIEDEWTVNGTLSVTGLLRRLSARLGLRWTGTDPQRGCEEDRWTASTEASVTARGTTLSGEYQRIEERTESNPDEGFIEHLIRVSIGRSF